MRRFLTYLTIGAAILVGVSVWAINRSCRSAVIGDAERVGTIAFRAGAEEVTVGGDLSLDPITTEGANFWSVHSTKGQDVKLKVFPLTKGGKTEIQNVGNRTVILNDGPGNPCANSVSPKARVGYAGIGSVEVY